MPDLVTKLRARIVGLRGLLTSMEQRDKALKDTAAAKTIAADALGQEIRYLGDEVASGAFAEEWTKERAAAEAAATEGASEVDIEANAVAVLLQRRLAELAQRQRAAASQIVSLRAQIEGVASAKQEEIDMLEAALSEHPVS